jgi:hypothetical protein
MISSVANISDVHYFAVYEYFFGWVPNISVSVFTEMRNGGLLGMGLYYGTLSWYKQSDVLVFQQV